MDRKTISIGLKVLVAVASGVAVFIGISSRNSNCSAAAEGEEPERISFGDRLSKRFHEVQGTCGKITAFMGSVSCMADTANQLFGNNSGMGGMNGGYYNNYGCQGMTQINPVLAQCGRRRGCYNNNVDGSYPTFDGNNW